LFWTITGSGITAADFTPSSLEGSLSLGFDRRAAFSLQGRLDGVSEGDEQLTLTFFSDAARTLPLAGAQFTLRDLNPIGPEGATDERDLIVGMSSDDVISGVPTGSLLNGRGSFDTLTGNGGNDLFVLGTSSDVYYNDGQLSRSGSVDFATISDFSAGDRIQLKGAATDYRLSSSAISGISGTLVSWRAAAGAGSVDEVIGFVQGLQPSALSLTNSSQFLYV
jgi:Ca2+-binding RTX toxin-like protein